jgi:hypothetical protein
MIGWQHGRTTKGRFRGDEAEGRAPRLARNSPGTHAPSYKAGMPEKRGRFNLGEQVAIVLCSEARIESTTGTVIFSQNDTTRSDKKRPQGTIFEGKLISIQRPMIKRSLSRRHRLVQRFRRDGSGVRSSWLCLIRCIITSFRLGSPPRQKECVHREMAARQLDARKVPQWDRSPVCFRSGGRILDRRVHLLWLGRHPHRNQSVTWPCGPRLHHPAGDRLAQSLRGHRATNPTLEHKGDLAGARAVGTVDVGGNVGGDGGRTGGTIPLAPSIGPAARSRGQGSPRLRPLRYAAPRLPDELNGPVGRGSPACLVRCRG